MLAKTLARWNKSCDKKTNRETEREREELVTNTRIKTQGTNSKTQYFGQSMKCADARETNTAVVDLEFFLKIIHPVQNNL